VHFGRKLVRNAVHNAFLDTLTMGMAFPRPPRRNDPPPGGAGAMHDQLRRTLSQMRIMNCTRLIRKR